MNISKSSKTAGVSCFLTSRNEVAVSQFTITLSNTISFLQYPLGDPRGVAHPRHESAGRISHHPQVLPDLEWAIGLNRTSLEIIGIWPREDSTRQTLFVNIRVLINALLIIFGLAIPSLNALIKNRNDPLAVIDNLQFFLPILITTMKLIVIWWNKGGKFVQDRSIYLSAAYLASAPPFTALLPVVNMIAKDWARLKSIKERNVMIKRARTAKRINQCCCIIISSGFVLLVILPGFGISLRYLANATDHERFLPLQSYYLYDVTKTPYFELTFLSQVISMAINAVCYTAVDNFLGLLLFHICGQLENLQARLTKMGDIQDFDYVLANNVKDHIRLIRSVNIVENAFSLLLLGLLMYFSTFVSVYGFLFIRIWHNKGSFSKLRIIYLLIVIVTVFINTFLQCILGEILVTQSDGVQRAICECEWEKLRPRKARYLILLLVRSKKPLCISAGKMFPITLPTFCGILKVSASYASFLLTKLE